MSGRKPNHRVLIRSAFVWGSIVAFIVFTTRLSRRVIRGVYDAANAEPFQALKNQAQKTVLFFGDSTVQGVGASSPSKTIAGLFAADHPHYSVRSHGKKGMKIVTALPEIQQYAGQHFDLVVLQIGGNDILRGTKIEEAEEGLRELLDCAEQLSERVVLIHGGDMGASPLFPPPLHLLWRSRTEKLRDTCLDVCEKCKTIYVDLVPFTHGKKFRKEHKKWFADDGVHPSDLAYQFGYDMIMKTLKDENVVL